MKNRGHKLLRQKGLGILREILPKQKIQEFLCLEYPKERKRALTGVLYSGLLIWAHIYRSISSVDELIELGVGQIKKVYEIKGRLISKQSFSQRSKVLPWRIGKRIYEYLLGVASQINLGGQDLFRDIYLVKLLDSTIFDVAARLIGVMASKPSRRPQAGKTKKGQVKLKTIFNWTGRLPELIQLKRGLSGELAGVKGMVRKAVKKAQAVILVFDLGFFCYEFLNWLINQGIYFVSRIKANTRYQVIKKLGRNDWLVKIGISAKYQVSLIVRLVRVKEKRRWYYYITNLMDPKEIKPRDIRLLYRYRWQIEIFFKELKYVLNIRKIFFYNPDGVKWQIYMALSTYVLGRILIAQSACRHQVAPEQISFPRAMTAVRIWLVHNATKIFCTKPRVQMVHELLDQIYEFAYLKKRPKRLREIEGSLPTEDGKDVA